MPIARPGSKTKVCSKCKKRKPLGRFGKHPQTTDGLQSQCNDCKHVGIRELRARTGNAYDRWYGKAERRALRRLKDMHPEDFERLFEEELAALPAPQYERKRYERKP